MKFKNLGPLVVVVIAAMILVYVLVRIANRPKNVSEIREGLVQNITPEDVAINPNQYIGKTVEWIMDIQEIVAGKKQLAETSPPIHACAG